MAPGAKAGIFMPSARARYSRHRTMRQMGWGGFPDVSLAHARDQAKAARKAVERHGSCAPPFEQQQAAHEALA